MSATFNGPQAITVTPNNSTLYIADTLNRIVRTMDVISPNTTKDLAGTFGNDVPNNNGVAFANAGLGVIQDLQYYQESVGGQTVDHLAVDSTNGLLDLNLATAIVTEPVKGEPTGVAVLGASRGACQR